jgi:outer membrane protein assembly factor BamE (lipoprotein component of BamABCDE complex)
MRKGSCLVLILALFIGIPITVFSLVQSPSRIGKAQYDQIRVGMSANEVNRILGGPPGNYMTFSPAGFFHIESQRIKGTRNKWEGDDGIIFVWFDDEELVIDLEFVSAPWERPSFFSRLRLRFGV